MKENSHSEELIFSLALALPVTARQAFVARRCGNDPVMVDRVMALLSGFDENSGFLEIPAAAGRNANNASRMTHRSDPTSEDRIGRYKVLERIGEGGCGVVYMAQQEGPVSRRVALKLIKRGLDTKEFITRFEAERQALALMDHPNIARVYDAGATDTGRPFLVMELIRGVQITKYCDENHLSPPCRLELFVQICQAIQHAHQKGIIHRDIKPSNILVTVIDGAPVPKIIDFGIAKATKGRLTDKTLFTRFHAFIGTPAYTSPEQFEMSGVDVDTRSDIYSLGVLLYELLTGQPPFDSEALLNSGFEAMRRTIRETEPPKPSRRLHTLGDTERTSIAQLRNTAPAQLALLLRGDLDWIVMRCLEKDRARRYETANGLATDIQRHLRNEPVVARPPSTSYLLQKLIRRHRLAFAAGSVVACSLVVGLGVSVWSLLNEKAARQRAVVAETRSLQAAEGARAAEGRALTAAETARAAEGEAQKTRQLADGARVQAEKLVSFLLEDFFHELAPTGRVETVGRLAEQAVHYFDGLPPQLLTPETARSSARSQAYQGMALRRQRDARSEGVLRAAVAKLEILYEAGDRSEATLLDLATALRALGEIIGNTVFRGTEECLAKADNILRPLTVSPECSSCVKLEFAEILYARAVRLSMPRSITNDESLAMLEDARRILETLGVSDLSDLTAASAYAKVTLLAGRQYGAENEHYQKEALALAEKILARSPADMEALRVRGAAQTALAENARRRFDYAAAMNFSVRAEQAWEEVIRFDPLDGVARGGLASARHSVAAALIAGGRISDGLTKYRRIVEEIETSEWRSHHLEEKQSALARIITLEAKLGNREAVAQALVERDRIRHAPPQSPGFETLNQARMPLIGAAEDRQLKLCHGEYEAVISSAELSLITLESLLHDPQVADQDLRWLDFFRESARLNLAEANIMLGRFARAEAALRDPPDRRTGGINSFEVPSPHNRQVWLALAIARQDRGAEVLTILTPALRAYRSVWEKGADALEDRENLARALYVYAVAQPDNAEGWERCGESLQEAAKLLEGLSAEAKQLYDQRVLIRWIGEARAKRRS